MTSNSASACCRLTSRNRLRAALIWLVMILGGIAATPAWAQNCEIIEEPVIDMGEVSPANNSTRSGTLRVRCSRGPLEWAAVRLCMNIPDGGAAPGLNPRWLTNHNGAQMAYDLFSDAARSRQIGPWGSGYPVYSGSMTLSLLVFSRTLAMPVYAFPRSGQRLPAAHPYESMIPGGQIRYAANLWGSTPSEADCMASRNILTFDTIVRATAQNTCRIVVSTDLDFGTVTSLPGNRDQTSAIQLHCPAGAAWQVGLDKGSHADGETRRMAGPGGRFLRYELYRDPQRTQRWGDTENVDTRHGSGTNATQTLTVFGRVPAQPTPTPGNYADTVTITLTY